MWNLRLSRVLHSGFKWLKPATKQIHLWFHEFLIASFSSRFAKFPFPVIACLLCSKFVKLLCAQLSTTSQFHEFLKSNFWRVFDVGPNCFARRSLNQVLYCTCLGTLGSHQPRLYILQGFFKTRPWPTLFHLKSCLTRREFFEQHATPNKTAYLHVTA